MLSLKSIVIRACVAGLGWVALLATTVSGAEPTFAAWRARCEALPYNRELNGRLPPRASLPLDSVASLEQVVDAFFAQCTNGPLANPTNWVGPAPARDGFFNPSRSWFTPPNTPFEPFVEKLVLAPGTRVFLEGDLHGDIHALLAVLARLQERRWLEGFKVIQPGVQIVFLGDYTDRGLYGVEVLYTLLRLRNENPGVVHLMRGNHEDVTLAARYGFLAEAQAKYGAAFNIPKIMRVYDFLPVALYLGCGGEFAQCCHGGMEPGFAPGPLLAAEGTNRFRLVGALKQATFLREHPEWLAADKTSAAAAREHLRDFAPAAPISPTVLGFMWNDFTVFAQDPAFAADPDRAFVYGRLAVEFLLRQAGANGGANGAENGKPGRVHAVFRGHQHSSVPNPLMQRLVASRGLFRHWQESTPPTGADAAPAGLATRLDVAPSRKITEGSVWTFNVAPDSVYGAGCQFDFATFGLLEVASDFDAWRIEVETVPVLTRPVPAAR